MHNTTIENKTSNYTIPKLERIDGEPRSYVTPEGHRLPSVTSVTGLVTRDSIQSWRKSVGAEKANHIASKASRRGTVVHNITEKFILGHEGFDEAYKKAMPDARLLFGKIKNTLTDRLSSIHALETMLWSQYLKVAGTVDCIGIFDGKLSVIDFKTASKPKQHDKIEHYFMQTAAYACAWYELTKEPINNLVVIIANDEDVDTQTFQVNTYQYLTKFQQVRKQFFDQYGF